MGIVLTTDERGVKVWRDDKGQYPRYSISFSKKDESGKYQNAYIEVRFKKGIEIANGTDIQINNAFPTFNVGKDGKKYTSWMITDFSYMNGGFDAVNIPIDIEDEEMPFE